MIRLGLFCLILCSVAGSGCEPTMPASRPNILFILADDLGYRDLSCMGSSYYETPHIDRIAQQGMLFTQGYAACQVCSPSRASLMTGKFPARHGITDWIGAASGEAWRKHKRYNQLLPAAYEHQLAHADTTLAEAFQAAGYATFFAGKWHLGNKGSYPEDHGFEVNQGGYERGGPYSGGYFSPFNNPKMADHPDEKGMSLSMKLARETSAFIEQHADSPFLAYLSFYAVHAPIQTTETKWQRYREKAEKQGISSTGFAMERRLPIRQHQDNPVYAGLIEHMDEAVGYVLETLNRLNLSEKTIVIFTSDNGGVASGDNFSTSNQPLRGGKGYQWEGGIRVPFLVKVPWLRPQKQRSEIPVNGTDFYPTLLELAGLPLRSEQHLDGQSFVPALKGEAMETRSLVWHYPHYGNQGGDPSAIIRQGEWKLIHYFETESQELYHLPSDISEQENVAKQHPEVVARLSKDLQNYLQAVQANMPSQDPLFDADSAEWKQDYYAGELRERLEKQRREMLRRDWKPNEDWWGSKLVGD